MHSRQRAAVQLGALWQLAPAARVRGKSGMEAGYLGVGDMGQPMATSCSMPGTA